MSSDAEDDRERIHQLVPEDEDEGARAGDSSEEDSSDDDDDDDIKVKRARVSVETLLKRTLQQIADGAIDLTRDDCLAAFKSKELHDLATDTGDKSLPTALHLLLDDKKSDLPTVSDDQMKVLVTCLVQHGNNLLAKGDRDGKTPLYQAIDLKKEKMVEWMCEAHRNINSIFIRPSNNQCYLHFAIKKKLKYFKSMVQNADPKTLALKDSKGNTILHLAVEYKRCRKDQLSIIEDIVARSDEEVRLSYGDFNRAGNSPYLHHKKTVEDAAKDATEAAAKAASGDKSRDPGDDRGRADPAKNGPGPKKAGRPSSPQRTPNHGIAAPGQQEQTRPKLVIQSNSRAKYGSAVPFGLTLEMAGGDDSALRTPVATEPSASITKAKGKSESKKQSKVDERVVKGVERFLKLHYLRSRSDNACMDILYGRDKVSDLELYFDLSGRSSMTLSGFEALLKQLKFEDALQYVAIPKIKIEAPAEAPSAKRIHRSRLANEGSGRRDLVQVFDGLRKKGVKTILKVVVDDSLSPPHTDEAIEESLRNLDVEVWDWKKTDLCTEVIYNAAPRVREVHLYWGGNNAVLRGWSDEGGLKKLSELRTVRLHIQKGLESPKRSQQYVKEFSERIKRLGLRHDLRLIIDDGLAYRRQTDNAVRAQGIKDEQTSKHTWIDCMKKFRGLLLNAEQLNEYRQMSQSIEEPIRVALIDDGVDAMDLEYPLLGGRTFCPRDEENNLNHPYYASATGHGTTMAKLIHFMCPRAQLYVLRLEDHPFDGVRQISARSAARAIAAAVKKKVHIISMSWTIDPPEDEGVKAELEKAILDADKANILMFCSAADQGAKQTDTYPSKATQRIFTIGAAGPSGETNAWVGNPDKVHFTFPGDRVEILDGAVVGPAKEVSGSSVATALAAGFAALVLYCVQVRLWHAPGPEKAQVRREFEALKRYDQLTKAFRNSIGTSPESKYKFITVWEAFGSIVDERHKYDDPVQLVEAIARLGARFCLRVML
ncbi:hypothetical protein MFIFM68171_07209 [Madurella fahalii]|uniref:Peptidase S8/S53 domain-containing protein n=1 Tax=Madurella fahalii TaxID=1157608 RepID=A0ABQ0GGY2_9PEZI